MRNIKMIAEMLGGTTVLHARLDRDSDLEEAVLQGLPTKAVRALARRTQSSLSLLQDVTHLDKTTFVRRERAKGRLLPDESDRVARVARVAALAVDAMGAADGLAWLHEPNYALGERVPIQMLKTEIGARRVEDVLLRIQHGVYS